MSPCRAVLITSGPSWTASSASSRRTQRAKRQAWPTCASSSRTVSTRCSPQRSCTCWAKRARAPRSPPSTSASSSTGWFWRARLFVQVRQHNELLYYFHLFYINCERGWCLTPGVCRSSKSQNPGLKKSLVYKENKLLGIAVQLQLCDYGEKKTTKQILHGTSNHKVKLFNPDRIYQSAQSHCVVWVKMVFPHQ